MNLRRSTERGHANHGWLDSYHSFSFADYDDPRWRGFRSLRVINDDLVMPGKGFGMHPHRDMEIITYVLSGSLEHRDSMGNRRVLLEGDIQYMGAGSGVRHSEFNPSAEEAAHFLQIWIEPDAKGLAPRYVERSLGDAAPGGLSLVASKAGREGSVAIHQDANVYIARLAGGDKATHRVTRGRHAWVHVAEGRLLLNGTDLGPGDAASLEAGEVAQISAAKRSQVLVFDLG